MGDKCFQIKKILPCFIRLTPRVVVGNSVSNTVVSIIYDTKI